MKNVTVPAAEEGSRLDHYLARLLPKAPKSFLYRMLRKKNITRNGKRAEGNERVSAGDVVTFYLSDETIASFLADPACRAPGERHPEILFEDADVLIVSKEAGMLVQGDRTNTVSLTDIVRAELSSRTGSAETEEAAYKVSPANRLDRNTSGIVLFGKTLAGTKALTQALRERNVTKVYLALTEGCGIPDGIYEAYLRKDEKTNTAEVSDTYLDGADPIRTGVKMLRTNGRESLFAVTLYTGRPHQIRAHLSHLGNPVMGDPKYNASGKRKDIRRQMLHAFSISFPEDSALTNLRDRTVVSPCPADMKSVIESLFGREVLREAGEGPEGNVN